ncbi:MAG TPA: rhomboid family intramembrane serine protease [Solirubrobacteraceae bacterium]|nr:rhomboid family intramembrane serine protease [Solirubrobacteraceae bacterium]
MNRNLPALRRQVLEGLALLIAITAFMWAIEGINSLDGQRLDGWGIHPRNIGDLWSVLTSWFVHANFSPHLVDNTIPFLFMGAFIALAGAKRLAAVTAIVILVGGVGTWLVAPPGTVTFGASGVVFGFATYLFARGLFDRNIAELLVGVIVGFVWGAALVDSVVPHQGVSWQAHVCGAVGGVVAAYVLATRSRKDTQAQRSGGKPAAAPDPLQAHHDALDRALSR